MGSLGGASKGRTGFKGPNVFHRKHLQLLEKVGSDAVFREGSLDEYNFVLFPCSELLKNLPRKALRQTGHTRDDDQRLEPI